MNTAFKHKLFSKKKLVYYSFIAFYVITLSPIALTFIHSFNSRNLTLYYPHTTITSTAHPFCTSAFILQKENSLSRNIEQTLRYNLLPNFNLALSFKENLISLQSVQLEKSTLVLDFSKEFYTLSPKEELTFTYSILLTLYHNFPKLSEVFITVNGISHQFLNSSLSYKTPFVLNEIPQKIEKHFSQLNLNPNFLNTFAPCPNY